MMDLTERKKELLSGKIIDLGNVAAAALIFGQFLAGEPVNLVVFVGGVVVVAACYLIGISI